MVTIDPYSFLWREETTNWSGEERQTVFGVEGVIPNHTYITKGTELFGYVPKGSKKVQWFSRPMKSWSPSRRSFRKLGRKEIAQFV